jgi:hypothetical protein
MVLLVILILVVEVVAGQVMVDLQQVVQVVQG